MPVATTKTQHEIIEHFKQLVASGGKQFWFIIQIGWVRDLAIQDKMSANDGFRWTEQLLNSAKTVV